MIKQNIKIAIVTIIGFITFWLIMFNFIKIDKSSQAVLRFDESTPLISIDKETSAYIQKRSISKINVEFNKQYFSCPITFSEMGTEYVDYLIIVPSEVYKTQQMLLTNIIVDTQNLYEYWFKK